VSGNPECFDEKMQALTRLAGGVAHRFNNMLSAILATTDLTLESAGLDAEVRSDLQDIRDAAKRAASLTRQLIAFSGSQSMVQRPTQVNDIVAGLEPMLAHVIPHETSLTLDLQSSETIAADPVRLEQTLLTLVLNAAEAVALGGTIRIATADGRDAGHTAYTDIIVSDDGHGMDELTRSRLFEPFSGANGELSDESSLGMAAVFGTMRQHGGSVQVESAPSRGCVVRLRFPRHVAPAVNGTGEATAASTPAAVVLVVEDELMVRAPVCRSLRNQGYFVLEANNGEHALTVMQEHHAPIHLVITDVNMPEMDGAELVGMLRDWYPRMRVLFISGYSRQYLETRAGSVQGSAFLAKPFSMDALRGRVRELLDSEWAESA
jgi:CheY-like chemotaxis protein